VAFDSTSRHSNLPMADFIADYLDRPGVRIERNYAADGDKANLVIAAGPERTAGEGIVLSGHMDVVPADEPEWRTDPFDLTETGGTYVGRGAADMKGFLALAVNHFAGIEPEALRRPLVLLFTYDEEVGTLGARRFSETWREPESLPRSVIIGEPTSLKVVRIHKGMLRLRLEFEGRAAHSGYPHLGRSAIEPAAQAIVALAELRRELERERPAHGEHFPEVPFAALNVGTVAGGSAANVIPDRCEVHLGVRLLPGMAADEMIGRIRQAIERGVAAEPFSLDYLSESPAMVLDEDAEIHRELREEVGQQGSHGVMFASDAGWLQRMGLECVLFGPGSIEMAHRPNEFLSADEFRRAGEVLGSRSHLDRLLLVAQHPDRDRRRRPHRGRRPPRTEAQPFPGPRRAGPGIRERSLPCVPAWLARNGRELSCRRGQLLDLAPGDVRSRRVAGPQYLPCARGAGLFRDERCGHYRCR
jgi:acetylornithine deacetylase